MKTLPTSRRNFLYTGAAAGAGLALWPAWSNASVVFVGRNFVQQANRLRRT